LRTTKIWSISLPPEMVKEAESVARKERRTKSELIREALRNYLNELKWRDLFRYGEMKARRKESIKEIEQLIDEARAERRKK